MRRFSQRGFALFEGLAIAGVAAIVALAGWNIYQQQQTNGSTTISSEKTVKLVPEAPAVASVSDLDKASQTLDQTQIDSVSDTAQLDKDLASF